MTRRNMDVIFYDYLSHLVLVETRSVIIESDWSYVDGYIWWFFRVSHPYKMQNALGDPLRSIHKEILEEE